MDKDIKEKVQAAAALLKEACDLAYSRGKSNLGYSIYHLMVKVQELAPKE